VSAAGSNLLTALQFARARRNKIECALDRSELRMLATAEIDAEGRESRRK